MRIAFLGNFTPPWSTENDLAWTMEKMGHEVDRLQESNSGHTINRKCDLFFWVHTHGWQSLIPEHLKMIREYHPTVMFHLDRYWGLNALDGREDGIGVHPMWKCDFVFTADGGNDAGFKVRGVNHFWSPPAIAERWCYRGKFRAEYAYDVAFVGSEHYHPEYQFRGSLIRWLRDNYGPRFQLFTGIRGNDLNDLYASVKVVVGDSCFAGADRYWSDRVPETLGRGGFLLHRPSQGQCIPHAFYIDFESLKEQIDYYLQDESTREAYITSAMDHILHYDTYKHRLEKIFDTVFPTQNV